MKTHGYDDETKRLIDEIENCSSVLQREPDGSYRVTGETVRQYEDRLKRTITGPHVEGETQDAGSADFHCPHCGWNVHYAALSHFAFSIVSSARMAALLSFLTGCALTTAAFLLAR